MENDETEDKKINWKWIIAIIILLTFLFFILPIPWRKYWYEDNGHFPWVGISAFIAAIGFIRNQMWERKKLNADIKSKSRIEWMVTVRDLLAHFMVDTERIYTTLSDLADSTVKKTSNAQSFKSKYNDERVVLSTTYRKLLLYIPYAADNKNLLNSIQEVWDLIDRRCEEAVALTENYRQNPNEQNKRKLNVFINKIDPKGDEQKLLMANIENLNAIGRQYFKHEWERAKKGE